MFLLEVADPDLFKNVKTSPEEDLAFLKRKDRAVEHQMSHIRDSVQGLMAKVAGSIVNATWDATNPDDAEQKPKIDQMLASGYIAVMKPRWGNWNEEPTLRIDCYLPDVPQNKIIAQKMERLFLREFHLEQIRRSIPADVRRAKGRLSAQRRKSPDYVSRATGKELLKDLRAKVEQFIHDQNWPYTINNSYYWAKNKMIVIEFPVRNGLEGQTPYQTAKMLIKPEVTKFLESIGLSQFRVIDKYFRDSGYTVIKIQIDDAEAKHKAEKDETVSTT